MRYHISGRIRPEEEEALKEDIRDGAVAEGTIFHGGMMAGLRGATVEKDDRVHFVEVCYCLEAGLDPMAMELPYLERYFDALEVRDARRRKACTMECEACDCTRTLRLPGTPLADRLGPDGGDPAEDYIDPGRVPLNRKRQRSGLAGLREALDAGAEVLDGGAAVKGFYVLFAEGDEFFRVKEIPDTRETRALLRECGLNGLGSVEGARRSARGSIAARDDKSNVV